jgi:large subunit ribosomal protein L19e
LVVNIRKKRELIARILGVGVNRVRFEPDKLDDVADSITRENKSNEILFEGIKGQK